MIVRKLSEAKPYEAPNHREYKSLRVFRQRSLQDWHGPMGEMMGRLRKRYPALEAVA